MYVDTVDENRKQVGYVVTGKADTVTESEFFEKRY